MKQYNFECYTKHPQTGETGWDIKWVGVFADSKEDARELLKSFPNFDCVLTFNFGGLDLDGLELDLFNNGIRFFERQGYMNPEIIKTYK